ncbi:MAG: segregation/condensation protein A [Planctomycetota bacterium]|nr:MAG: segregation/condensation protein A [Planctomycetota bacterium]
MFLVETELYSGPMDLLLHIVRRDEIPLAEIPLARIIDQYLSYLEVLVELQIDDVAEFIEVASLLLEMKSKQAIPVSEDSEAGEAIDPSAEMSDQLVYRLMEYKRIRDAASILEDQGQVWQLRYSRLTNDLPPRRTEYGDQPIEPIEVWDLVSAFGRILRERQPPPSENVVYDDTPIHVYMERIHRLVCEQERVELTALFEPGMHKSALVAMFLATLELTRHYGLATDQRDACQPLYLVPGPAFQRELDVQKIDNLTFEQVAKSNLPTTPR